MTAAEYPLLAGLSRVFEDASAAVDGEVDDSFMDAVVSSVGGAVGVG